MLAYFNPYSGTDFWQFFALFFKRLWDLLTGQLGVASLASDEVQIFVLVLVSMSSALVGVFLVLRRMTMLANALSHTILFGIVLAYLITKAMSGELDYEINLEAMLIASLLTGIVTTFLTEFLHKTLKLQEDASIGLVFTTFFAAGIILVTLFTRNAHVGTDIVMGNVDALHVHDLKLVGVIALSNILLITLFFKEYLITTFDPALSKALGFSAVFFNYLLMVQVSATSIGAFRAVGVLMVLAFIVGPPLIARLLTHRLLPLLFLSVGIGALASLLGVAMSRHFLSVNDASFSTGGLTVCWILIFYVLALLFAPKRGALAQRRFFGLSNSRYAKT